jgi:dTDP-4-dehydrorhamnose 3,5-epimerase
MEKNFIKIKPCKKIDTFDADKKPNGWVLELVSDRDNFTKQIKGQLYMTVAEPGLFKGFHLHAAADYFITCIKGHILETIYQDRISKQEIKTGDGDFKTIFVPKGCPHGIKNIGNEPAYIVIYRYPAWDPDVKEQLDIAPEDIETEDAWKKIEKFVEHFR